MKIESVLPHRYPFLFIDRIVACEPGSWARGVKNVTRNEWFFQGHFPGEPIMPGVLITEAIAQMAAFAVKGAAKPPNKAEAALPNEARRPHNPAVAMIASINGIKFIAPVVPGDQLELYFEILSARGPFVKGKGKALVNGNVVASVEEIIIMAKAAKQEAEYEGTARSQ